MKILLLVMCVLCCAGCASRQPDYFYVLAAEPADAGESGMRINLQVALSVTLPSLVDRSQMVLATQDGVAVMEHERWAAPLAELMTAALRQDIERRRGNVLVSLRGVDSGVPSLRIEVEVLALWARRGAQVSLETQWRVTDTATRKVSLGREAFTAPVHSDGYAAVAAALSTCVGLLADRLAREIPAG
ncbi:MAG: membrane integrity-associated transporter subunit PqiC [Steroidobacteraceae bacterium]